MAISELLYGDRLMLSAVEDDDIPIIIRWHMDSHFSRHLMGSVAAPQTRQAMRDSIERMQKSKTDYVMAVRQIEDDVLVGIVEIDGILWHHRVCGLAIGIAPGHQGKGYGREAMALLLDFVFSELNMYRAQLSAFSYNENAIALYDKIGFTREGVQREFLERDGQRFDSILFGMLRHEWDKLSGK